MIVAIMQGCVRNCRLSLFVGVACLITTMSLSAADSSALPGIYAIRDATIVIRPGTTIENGTVVIRDGLIEAVGKRVQIPADAVVIDGAGAHVYAGLIDPLGEIAAPAAAARGRGGTGGSRNPGTGSTQGAVHPLSLVHPELRARDLLKPFVDDDGIDKLRALGFTTRLLAPDDGIFRGSSVVVQLHDDRPVTQLILRDDVAQHAAFQRGGFGGGYPGSLMGSVATMRQTLLDARRHQVWNERYDNDPVGMRRPDFVPAFDALAPLLAGEQPMIIEAESPEDVLLADRLAREFDLDLIVRASGFEWEIAERIAATGRTLLLSLEFPRKPKLTEDADALDVTLKDMRRYVGAAAAPRRLHEAGIRFAFTMHGMRGTGGVRKNLAKIVEAGLDADVALAALTTTPAEILGLQTRLGSIEKGKIANLVMLDGPLFDADSKTTRVFIDGQEYRIKQKKKPRGDPDAIVDPRGTWNVMFEIGARTIEREWIIAGETDAYNGTAETREGVLTFEEVTLEGNLLSVTFPARGGRDANTVTVVITENEFEGVMEMGPRSIALIGNRASGPEGASL